jgi:hypothetical protein
MTVDATLDAGVRVCVRCGEAAGEQSFCGSCGLNLAAQTELPTRAQWEESRTREASPSALPPPGWHEDPAGDDLRWWDGEQWSESTRGRTPGSPPSARPSSADAHNPVSPNYPPAPSFPRPESPAFAYGPHSGVTDTATRAIEGRSRRNKLLGAGGITLSGGMFLYAIGSILLFAQTLDFQAPTGTSFAQAFDFLFAALLIAATAVTGAAFLGAAPSRSRLLRVASCLGAGAFIAEFVNNALSAAEAIVHHGETTYVASNVVAAIGTAALVVAASLAWTAFARTRSPAVPEDNARKDQRLGLTAILVSVWSALLVISTILLITAYSDSPVPGGFKAGLGTQAFGYSILIGAAVCAAVAFFRSRSHRETGQVDVIPVRDGLMSVAALVAGLAYLVMTIGWVMFTSSAAGFLLTGKGLAASWLDSVQTLGWSAGLVCASVGLYLSRRSTK